MRGGEVGRDLRLQRHERQHLRPVPNDGQGSARDDGLPLAAKLAQSVRMLAASACWAAVSMAGNGAFGWSNRYGSSVPCVAMGGSAPGFAMFTGALSSLNW